MAELCDMARLNGRRWNAGCGLSYLVNLAVTEGCEVVGSMTGRIVDVVGGLSSTLTFDQSSLLSCLFSATADDQ